MLETTQKLNPQTLKEFEKQPSLEIMMELTFLNIARLAIVFREELNFPEEQQIQMVFPYADAAIFQDMALEINRLLPRLKINPVGKALSMNVMYTYQSVGKTGVTPSSELLDQMLLNDKRFGVFNPNLPTIWIDSVYQFRFVEMFEKNFKTSKIGSPAWFFTVHYLPKTILDKHQYSTKFDKVISPNYLFGQVGGQEEHELTFQFETTTRLPIKQSYIRGSLKADEPELKQDQSKSTNSSYFPALTWIHGPQKEARRKELIAIAQNEHSFLKESATIISKAQSLHKKNKV